MIDSVFYSLILSATCCFQKGENFKVRPASHIFSSYPYWPVVHLLETPFSLRTIWELLCVFLISKTSATLQWWFWEWSRMSEDLSFRLKILFQQIWEVNLENNIMSIFKNIFQCKAHVPFLSLIHLGIWVFLKALWRLQEVKVAEILSFWKNLMLRCKKSWHSLLIWDFCEVSQMLKTPEEKVAVWTYSLNSLWSVC